MRSGKRPLSVLVAIIMIISMLSAMPFAEEKSGKLMFSDMPNNWSTAAIENAIANGLLKGTDGKILPNDNLTRAQMATVITRAFGATVKGDLKGFSDVKSDDWFADYMAKAYQMGVIKGSDGKLNPNDPITRQEVFAIIARALKLQPAARINKSFSDINEISNWAKGEVYAVVNAGYVQGSDGKLNPIGKITRAEFAQVFDNILKQYIQTEGTTSVVKKGNIMVNKAGVTLVNLTIDGDLIIGDGVGDGDITLDNVKIVGRLVVRGGGENSIIIKGNSNVSTIILTRIDGKVSIKVQDDTNIEIVYIDDGSNDVSIEGTVGNVEVNASGIVVAAIGAEINSINITGKDSKIIIDEDSIINTVDIKRETANVSVDVAGTVDSVITVAENTVVTGTGTVKKVKAKEGAKGAKIETPSTEIIVDKGATGVTGGGGTEIKEGTSAKNNSTGTESTPITEEKTEDKGGTGGTGDIGDGDTGSGSTTISVSAISVSPKTMTLKVGTIGTIIATVSPSNATNKTVTWTTSDANVATVANGVITAAAEGTATITATSAADSSKKDSCVVTVEPVSVTGVTVKTAPDKVTYIAGDALDLTGLVVTLTKSDASTEDVAFADFASKGITASPANGATLATTDTEVAITVNGKTATQAITVNAAPDPGIIDLSLDVIPGLKVGDANVAANAEIGILSVTGGTAAFIYELVADTETPANSADNVVFAIDTDKLKVAVGGAVTEAKDYKITVKVTDSKGKTFTKGFTVTVAEVDPIIVTTLDLTSLVTAPVKGATPNTTAIDEAQYTGTIAWYESNGTTTVTGNFAASTEYVTKVFLTAKTGYTFTGVSANTFTYTGATNVVNEADSGEVTITFPATAAEDQVAKPVINLSKTNAANRETGLTFTVGAADGVSFYYTLDGSNPTGSSTAYIGEVILTAPDSDDEATITIKVIGVKADAIDSEVASETVTYAAKTYTVTFDSRGGSSADPITGIAKNATVTLPAAPTKDEHIFGGWFTDDEIFVNEFTASTEVTADITVYAKWTEVKPVAFHYAGSDVNGISFVLFEIYRENLGDEPEPKKITDLTVSDFTLIKNFGTEHAYTIDGIRFNDDKEEGYSILPPESGTFEDGESYRLIFEKTGYRAGYIDVIIGEVVPGIEPEGALLHAAGGSNFIGVLYAKDGNIYYNQIDTDGNWGTEVEVATGTEGRMAVDSTGKSHVVYTTDGKIGYRMYDGSVWTDEVLIESNNAGGGAVGFCYKPDIDIDNNGKAHITYTDTKGKSEGDPEAADIMYVTNKTGIFQKTVIFNGGYNSWGIGNAYYNKGSYITVDDSEYNHYYILTHEEWIDGTQPYKQYVVKVYSNIHLDKGVVLLGYNGGNPTEIEIEDKFDIFDLIKKEGKFYALYRDGNVKSTELTLFDYEYKASATVNAGSITSAYSHNAKEGNIVTGSKDSNDNLQVHFNGIPRTYDSIIVAGDAVSIVHLNGIFYALYTDNGGSIKIQPIEAPSTYIVSTNVISGTATVTTIPAGNAAEGSIVTVTIADIEEGKRFKSISVIDAESGTVDTTEITVGVSYTFRMPAKAVTVTVEVEAIPVATVTGISVKKPPAKTTYIAGDALDLTGLVVTLTKSDASTEDVAFADFASKGITASPANGATLATTDTEVAITVNGKKATFNVTIVADEPVFTLTMVSDPETGGSCTGGGAYTEGTQVSLTATESAGYVFKNWTIEDEVISEENEFTYTMPKNNVTITANFSKLYTLYTGADPGGAGTVTEQGQYPEGAVITLDYTENIGYVFSHWKVDGVDYSADDTLEYVMPDSDSTVIAKFRPIADINVWDGTVASSMFRLSDGTYLIRTGSELAWIAEQTNPLSNPDCTNFKGVKFKLVCNLDLDNRPWTPIGLDRGSNTGWFSGIFQGGNKTIKNLKVDVGGAGAIGGMDDDTPADVIIAGLFGQLGPTAKITGLKLQRVNITSKASSNSIVGGIAGYNYGIISKCSVGGNIVLNTSTKNNCAGGIVGLNRSTGTVEKSFSTARVTITKGEAKAGGIIGLNGGTIEKCFNNGRVTSSGIAGGIAADNMGIVKDCFNANVITSRGRTENDYAGGVLGVNGGNISTCYSTGKVSATSGVSGGVIGGNFRSTTEHCYYLAGTAPAGVGEASDSIGTATSLNEVQIQDRMHAADNFVGFDFMKVWYFKEDYPPPHLLEFKKPPAGECELELEVEPEDAGTVTGGGRYLSGIKVEISATPKAGGEFIFKNWTVGGVPISSRQTYEYRMPKDDVTVTANFEVKPKPHYTLTVTAEEGGTVTGGGSYEAGLDVSLSAEAHEGYEFEKWMIDSKTIGTDASMTYTMPGADTTIVGVFKLIELPAEPDKYKLTLCVEPEEGGTVTGGGFYEADEVVTITAEAYDGYKFEKWTIDGKTISTDASMTFWMPAEDIAITAHFIEGEPDLYLLTLNINLPGAGTVTGAGEYPEGAEVLLSAVPNEGYKFISWTAYGSTLGGETELAYTMPCWGVEITANFKPVCSGGDKCPFKQTGTLEDPIQIRTRELLEHINEHIEQAGLHYKLMNSISLSGADWTPIGITLEEEGYAIGDYDEFSGCFDGNGHTISNMTVNFTQFEMAYGGLFGYIVEGEVKDLILKDVDITINAYMGHEGGGGSAYAGGIAGAADSTVIENCSVSGEIRISPEAWLGYPTLGGIAGACRDGIIRGCSNYANVTAQSGNTGNEAGGIVGVSSGNSIITGCLNEGIITTDQAWGKMYTSNFSGGIAGGNYGDIVSCYNKGEVYAKRGYISRNAGGVAGYSYGNVLACYNTGSVEASAGNRDNLTRAGGLIGNNHGEACASYSAAKVSAIGGTKSQGGVAGANASSGTIKDCAYLRSIDGIPYEPVGTGGLGTGGSAGGLARGIMPEGFSSIKYCPYCGATGVSPLSCLDDTHESVEIRAWLISGLSYPKLSAFYTYIPPTCGCHDSLGAFYSGNGTESNPYKIYTEHQLHHISSHCAEGDVIHYRLEDDIDVEEPWIPIGSESKPFNGVLDGNGYVVRNLTMNKTADDKLHIGLFGVTGENSKIHNLRLENVNIQFNAEDKSGRYYVGAFAGKNKGLIEGCSVSGLLSASVTDTLTGVGGIAGKNEGSIARCYNSSTIEMNSYGENGGSDGGGIVADNCSIIEDCYNTGEILLSGGVENRAAGIAASNFDAEVRKCYNIGTITARGASNVNEGAGIVVYNVDGTVAYCYNNADTSNQTIVVPEVGTVENCGMLTDEQMKDVNRWADYFAGFEWGTVWEHGTSGYPYPQLVNNVHVTD